MWNWGHHFEILKYESRSEGFSSFLELPSLLQCFHCSWIHLHKNVHGRKYSGICPPGLPPWGVLCQASGWKKPPTTPVVYLEQFHISESQDQFWLWSLKDSQPYKIEKSLDWLFYIVIINSSIRGCEGFTLYIEKFCIIWFLFLLLLL